MTPRLSSTRSQSPSADRCRLLLNVTMAAIALAAIATAASANPTRIADVDYPGGFPTRVANHKGLFKAEWVDAIVEYSALGRDNLCALRARQTDYALMGLTPLAIDLAWGADPREADDPVNLASLVRLIHLTQVAALDNATASEAAELSGKRIGLMARTKAEVAWARISAWHGIDPAATKSSTDGSRPCPRRSGTERSTTQSSGNPRPAAWTPVPETK